MRKNNNSRFLNSVKQLYLIENPEINLRVIISQKCTFSVEITENNKYDISTELSFIEYIYNFCRKEQNIVSLNYCLRQAPRVQLQQKLSTKVYQFYNFTRLQEQSSLHSNPRQGSADNLCFDKFTANMPFHPVLNNNASGIIKLTKLGQNQKKYCDNMNSPATANFKSPPRQAIYSSVNTSETFIFFTQDIKNPAIGQYDITTLSPYKRITRNIFIPISSYDSLRRARPNSLEHTNLVELFKRQYSSEKIAYDFSKQIPRDIYASLLGYKMPRDKVQDGEFKYYKMDQDDMRRDFKFQSNIEDLILQKFKSLQLPFLKFIEMYAPYIMKIRKQFQPVRGFQFREAQKKIQFKLILQMSISNNHKVQQRAKKPAITKWDY